MDLTQHLKRQMAFSRATFGPGERRKGVSDHIKKELDEEILADEDMTPFSAAKEWVDIVILGLDGLTRALAESEVDWSLVPSRAAHMIQDKQTQNEQRDWPNWRTADPNKANEHIREDKS